MSFAKRLASRLPLAWQDELKRWHFHRQISRNQFSSDEPEFSRLQEWVHPGDWAVDVGANVGHFTRRLSQLVGRGGRVIAFEPIPATFAILAANVRLFEDKNVSLLNVAASDHLRIATLRIPSFDTGLLNYYQASLSPSAEIGCIEVPALAAPIDLLLAGQVISLVKIDAEGHEFEVLRGMESLLAASHPTLIVEGESEDVAQYLRGHGYEGTRVPTSPNTVFVAAPKWEGI